MALSFANTQIILRATFTDLYTEITLDSSYNTGGETINASDVGLREILTITPNATKGYSVEALKTNPAAWLFKVYSFSTNTNTVAPEMVSGKDLSTVVIPCRILGR